MKQKAEAWLNDKSHEYCITKSAIELDEWCLEDAKRFFNAVPSIAADFAESVLSAHAASTDRLREAFKLLQVDNHYWSVRGCSTCQSISDAMGEAFGCILYAQQRQSTAMSALEETKQ